jgi:SPP1 gp7 family putative phage head morphogenesis protein
MSDFLLDATVRHAVFVQRYASGQAREIKEPLFVLRDNVVERLLSEPDNFDEVRMAQLMEAVGSYSDEFSEDFSKKMSVMIEDFSESETEFSYEMLAAVVIGAGFLMPDKGHIARTVARKEMSVLDGAGTITAKDATTQFTKKKGREIIRTINDAILLGSTTKEAAANVSELISLRQAAQAESLTKTTANFISAAATDSVITANSALFAGYQWVSILDSRTTLICAGRDGNIYPVGKGPLPPAHWGCRSRVLPLVKPEFEKDKAGAGSSRPSPKDYGDWLKSQPASFQDEYFSKFPDGAKKAKLFRAGGLPIERFRDELGAEYTLEQLRNLNPVAFQRAGVAL